MSQPAPSIGRTVHYVSHGTPYRPDGTQEYVATCRAAIVTEVNAEEPYQVGLSVLNPEGLFFRPLSAGGCFLYQPDDTGCSLPSNARLGGSWHWPERVA
ncbi:hypothetical protein [Streptomyces sp. NPDC057250]|uniref:hypothetical protein n=1 Tax=Streptomyces sp. NPDC057250 TaxID=3346068 RepID=UPI003637B288